MKVVNFSDARVKLKSILDQVVNDAEYTVITRGDADDAVVMSLEQFNGLMETIHLLKSPANAVLLNFDGQCEDHRCTLGSFLRLEYAIEVHCVFNVYHVKYWRENIIS